MVGFEPTMLPHSCVETFFVYREVPYHLIAVFQRLRAMPVTNSATFLHQHFNITTTEKTSKIFLEKILKCCFFLNFPINCRKNTL